MNVSELITPNLLTIREAFLEHGRDIRFVGGCVRDLVRDDIFKDIDLATDAFPEEQIAIYENFGLKHVKTGFEHGTVTVILNGEEYQITSLRADLETDGRHAKVAFTRSWDIDLSRRDLTFNAMAVDFEGNLLDPFGGEPDAKNGMVCFVGEASQRIKEDYLRVLRYFRFLARYDGAMTEDVETAIRQPEFSSRFAALSKERLWAELKKIMVEPYAVSALEEMNKVELWKPMGLKRKFSPVLFAETAKFTSHPVTRFAAATTLSVMMTDEFKALYKAANLEAKLYEFLISTPLTSNWKKLRHQGIPAMWIKEFFAYQGQRGPSTPEIMSFQVKPCPVNAFLLMEYGFKGKQLGEALKVADEVWLNSDYKASPNAILRHVIKLRRI